MERRRFPPPWSVEDVDAAFVVKDGTGQKLAVHTIGVVTPAQNLLVIVPGIRSQFDEFKTSKKLRTELSLPWAGDTVIEFDTSGASEALSKMPCEER
jgi:hypothetical protein